MFPEKMRDPHLSIFDQWYHSHCFDPPSIRKHNRFDPPGYNAGGSFIENVGMNWQPFFDHILYLRHQDNTDPFGVSEYLGREVMGRDAPLIEVSISPFHFQQKSVSEQSELGFYNRRNDPLEKRMN
ncbi:TPA: hypothetical protein HA361_04425 [Candidatus Woesearchaeota archaeon]|nr:hypothetical protein [Candidatus Woesearchaeota archaeon]HII68319.1 hypothetical protein [Candidatus Woesearchaeota archaeon]